jgi:hypothetical protein
LTAIEINQNVTEVTEQKDKKKTSDQNTVLLRPSQSEDARSLDYVIIVIAASQMLTIDPVGFIVTRVVRQRSHPTLPCVETCF